MKLDALVVRKTEDLWRHAAEDLLRDAGVACERVSRGDLWSFEVDDPAADEDVRQVLDETTLVVNPNVHRYSREGFERAPESGCRVFVRVRDRVDARGSSVARSVRNRLGMKSIRGVSRSVLWTLDLATRDPTEAERIGRELAGLGERGAGILANPHSQEVEVRVTAGRAA